MAALLIAAGSAQAEECDARNAPGPYLVRASEHKVPLFHAMLWTSRPETPRAVSMSCLPGFREQARQRVSAEVPRAGQQPRQPGRTRPGRTGRTP